jgi:hypothetical protein
VKRTSTVAGGKSRPSVQGRSQRVFLVPDTGSEEQGTLIHPGLISGSSWGCCRPHDVSSVGHTNVGNGSVERPYLDRFTVGSGVEIRRAAEVERPAGLILDEVDGCYNCCKHVGSYPGDRHNDPAAMAPITPSKVEEKQLTMALAIVVALFFAANWTLMPKLSRHVDAASALRNSLGVFPFANGRRVDSSAMCR